MSDHRRKKRNVPARNARKRNMPARPMYLAAGLGAGAGLMYYFDPGMGRRRRALVRDQFSRLRRIVRRDLPERLEQKGRFYRGVGVGVAYNVTSAMEPETYTDDDATLVARVRSEVLRDPELNPGEINIDAYEGRVTLRGQLPRPEDVRRLVEDTERVSGVRSVRNYLHLVNTPAPNVMDTGEPVTVPSSATGSDASPSQQDPSSRIPEGSAMGRFTLADLQGKTVRTIEDEPIGTVQELYYAKPTGELEWLGVDTGWLGWKRRAVPFEDARVYRDAVYVAVGKAEVENSPSFDKTGEGLSPESQRQMCAHYGKPLTSPGRSGGLDAVDRAAGSIEEKGE